MLTITNKYNENINNFVYLSLTISSNALTDTEISFRIGKASETFARQSVRV